MGRHVRHWNLLLAALLLLALPAGATALDSATCLGCHSDAGAVGTELTIDPRIFDHTAHGELGCPTCHESVTDQHPDDGLSPSKATCQDCHQEIGDEYARTGHAANAACGDCHNPHTVHATREVSGQDMNRPCAGCHGPEEMVAVHEVWLPQADLHLEMLPCISCHTGAQNYVITLYLSKPGFRQDDEGRPVVFRLVRHQELQALAGDKGVASLIDTDGDNFVTLAELKRFNGSTITHGLRLKGMFTPEVVTHNLQILDNRWDCTFCHASGPGAVQTSFVALPRPDGSFERLRVEKGAILDALNGTPDFYMMGATRNGALNGLGLVILAGGLIMPVGHGFLRFLTRKNRQ